MNAGAIVNTRQELDCSTGFAVFVALSMFGRKTTNMATKEWVMTNGDPKWDIPICRTCAEPIYSGHSNCTCPQNHPDPCNRMTYQAMREALLEIVKKSPPNWWEFYGGMGDYNSYGESSDPDYVDVPDISNSGDMHSHGWDCGRWSTAVEIRKILNPKKE